MPCEANCHLTVTCLRIFTHSHALMLNSPDAHNQTMYIEAVNEIQSKIKKWAGSLVCLILHNYACRASGRHVHIYAFNVHPEQLQSAHDLLDKAEGRRAMRLVGILIRPNFWHYFRVTYSDDHNFIVRYMPGAVHNEALSYWTATLLFALTQLTPPPYTTAMPPGCMTFHTTSMCNITQNFWDWAHYPFFLQPFNLDQRRSRQILVSGLLHLTFLALSLRLGIQKVLHS
jgi:hypothetical protein